MGRIISSFSGSLFSSILLFSLVIFSCQISWAQQEPIVDTFQVLPNSGWAPLDVNFNCTAHDPDGQVETYILEPTGGGTYAFRIENDSGLFSYTYEKIGTFNADCKVVDNSDLTSQPMIATVNVYGTELSANNNSGAVPLSVSFYCKAHTPNDPIQNYSMNYGDGSPSETNQTGSFSHTYNTIDTFEPVCTATDNIGGTDTAAATVQVQGVKPIVDSFTPNPASGLSPLDVNFTCIAHDPDGDIKSYTFDPTGGGSGSVSIENETGLFSYTYNDVGKFSAACRAVDYSDIASEPMLATIDAYGVELSGDPIFGGVPISVGFTCYAHVPNEPIQSYRIDYDDGSQAESNQTGSFTHTYTSTGTFFPACTATDSLGAQFNSAPLTVEFPTLAPIIESFTGDPTSGSAPLLVEFNCAAQDTDGVVESYTLDPVSGGSAFVAIENHTGTFSYTYQDRGSYKAACIVADDLGAKTVSDIVTINVEPPPSTTGVFRPSNGLIYLKKENSTGYADTELVYGIPGDIPIAGDWDGDGIDSIGIYRNGVFYLKNSNETGYADVVFAFGADGDLPVAGDWDGDGVDTIGVYRDGLFMLRNSNDSGPAEMYFALGIPGDIPIAGNWDGDGIDSCGVFRPTNGLIYLKNENSTGYADIEIVFGIPNDKPIVGDWDGDGIDTIGVYRDGAFLLRNTNETGYAEMYFGLGIDGDIPISGKWGLP